MLHTVSSRGHIFYVRSNTEIETRRSGGKKMPDKIFQKTWTKYYMTWGQEKKASSLVIEPVV